MPADDVPWYLSPQEGLTISLATRDAQGRPRAGRAAAARKAPDGKSLVVYIPVPEGLPSLQNVSDNGQLTVMFARPTDLNALQFGGIDAHIVSAPDDEAFVRQFVETNFAALLAPIAGGEVERIRRFHSPEAVGVSFTPQGGRNKSPGANAGREISI